MPLSARTVGRGQAVLPMQAPTQPVYRAHGATLHYGNALACYPAWPAPSAIISDGAYGVLGFEGDTLGPTHVPAWYEPHVKAWSAAAQPNTTLWFWNSEIGWAAAHPVLERHGWRYTHCNIWNKGVGHIAGNINTRTIRRFPVVTEVCVHYVFEPRLGPWSIKDWLRHEWQRTGLPFSHANRACGVKDAAVRKYFDRGHMWYPPPPDAMQRLSNYANTHGHAAGRPYFSLDGRTPVQAAQWSRMRAKFCCPHGVTNVWERAAVRGAERVTHAGRAVHLNQKPLDLLARIIEVSTEPGDVIWEPFGGLFTAAVAGTLRQRRVCAAEIDATYFHHGVQRFARAMTAALEKPGGW